MSDWTPGPWTVVPYGDGYSLTIHSDAENRVCFMATPGSRGSWDRIQADARLIASAPKLAEENARLKATQAELADALRGLMAMAEDLAAVFPIKPTDEGMTALARARAALAKLEADPSLTGGSDAGD